MVGGKKKKSKKGAKDIGMMSAEDLIGELGLFRRGVPEGCRELDSYSLNPPFAYACIAQNLETAEYIYVVDELTLAKEERDAYKRLKNILGYELKDPEPDPELSDIAHCIQTHIMSASKSSYQAHSHFHALYLNQPKPLLQALALHQAGLLCPG